METTIGIIGSSIFLGSYMAQIFTMLKTKKTEGISYQMLFILALGTIFYTVYFLLVTAWALATISILCLVAIMTIAALKLNYENP